jgi:hypothetical protein
MSMKWVLVFAVPAMLLGATKPAAADIVYTTFGSGMSYNTGEGVTISGTSAGAGYFAQANTFTPSANYSLDSVSLPLLGQGSINVLLAADASGHPGTTVENLGSVIPNFTVSIKTFDSASHSLLTSGTKYWLVVQPTDSTSGIDGGWSLSTPVTPPGERRTSPTGAWVTSPFQGEAFQINGTAVPEPSSFILLGLTSLLLFSRRRKAILLP